MQKEFLILVAVIIVAVTALIIFRPPPLPGTCPVTVPAPVLPVYEDGTYRGGFMDLGDIQVNLQFTLEDGVVTAAEFRHLRRDDDYYLGTETEPYRSVVEQYREALDYLVGKDLSGHLDDLYRPGEIVTTEVDGYSGATIRSSKIISAVRDALNRGVYSY